MNQKFNPRAIARINQRGDAILLKNLRPGLRPAFKAFCHEKGTTMQAAFEAFMEYCIELSAEKNGKNGRKQ